MSDKRLYGERGAERLCHDLSAAVEEWFASCNLEPADARLPWTVTLSEFSVLPPGDSGDSKVMTGWDIADWVVESFGDDCGFEELYDQYKAAAKKSDVIVAFDAARSALLAHQTFLVADRELRRIDVTFTDVDEHLCPTWTLGEWRAA